MNNDRQDNRSAFGVRRSALAGDEPDLGCSPAADTGWDTDVRDKETPNAERRTPNIVSLHGFTLSLPSDWELAGLSGDTLRGYIVLARTWADRPGREAVVRVAWRRGGTVHAERTLTALGREWSHRPKRPTQTTRTDEVWSGQWSHDGAVWHGAVRVHGDVALTARALVADVSVTDLLATAVIADAERTTTWPWCVHGVELDLPSAWRLRGLVHQAGLVRALWEHLPARGTRPDAVLVVRRMACAERLLAGGTVADWLRREQRPDDVVERESSTDDVFHLTLQRRGTTWWRRWRGQRERMELSAWVDGDGRLMVVEQRGGGEAAAFGVRRSAFGVSSVRTPMTASGPVACEQPGFGSSPANAERRTPNAEPGKAGVPVPCLSLAPGVTLSRSAAGHARLTAAKPMRQRWWSRPVAALELDDIGTWVVERIDGRPVAALAHDLAAHLRLNRREAEVALGDFVRQLAARKLVIIDHRSVLADMSPDAPMHDARAINVRDAATSHLAPRTSHRGVR